MVTLDQIARQASAVMEERQVSAGMLWLGRHAGMEICRISMTSDSYAPRYGLTLDTTPVFGMRLNIDDYLPPDVWRLADDHGTLLYDCREGKTLRDASAETSDS
jgi:hypothetical protein